MNQWHTISVLVNNQPGVLQRVTSLFGRRGFNIESITVGASEEVGMSRMVIVTIEDEALVKQMSHQLEKLVDVVRVLFLSQSPVVARELALIKVQAPPAKRPEIIALVETFRATVVDFGSTSIIMQVVGETDKIEAMIELLQPFGVIELTRTGVTAMARGNP